MKRRKPFPLKWIPVILVALLALEFALRLFFGFGQLPLYYTSTVYEYALRPDQDLTRFGKHFSTNEEGMRSAALGTGEHRVLKFGDSVLNGGVRITQDSLSSSRLENMLREDLPQARVLNVSAGSWGVDNAFSWMREHGDFDAEVLVLVFSSHDWTDTMTFRDVVNRVPYYPGTSPRTAIGDALEWVYSRYLQEVDWESLPKIKNAPPPTKSDHSTGWENFVRYAEERNLPLIVYHHTTQKELKRGAWSPEGSALEEFLKNSPATVVSGFDAGYDDSDYLDDIHLSTSGQRKLARLLYPPTKTALTNRDA